MKRTHFSKLSRDKLLDYLYTHTRTGENFKSMRRTLAGQQAAMRARGQYFFVTRHTVLGRLKELKGKVFDATYPWADDLTRDELVQLIRALRSKTVATVEVEVPF